MTYRGGGYFRSGGGAGGGSGGGDMTGAEIATALTGLAEAARGTFLVDMADGLVGDGELWKNTADSSTVEGAALVEEALADPSDVAEGTNTTLGTNIAIQQFWRMQQPVAQASPLTLHFPGSSTTMSDTNHTLDVRVTGVTAAVPWQVAEIAAGLEDVEFMVTFVNAEGNTNNAFPQNHVGTGATVSYDDGVEEADLVIPTGSGSELGVFCKIVTTGATGSFKVTGFRKDTA
jgi:hypothetical protein